MIYLMVLLQSFGGAPAEGCCSHGESPHDWSIAGMIALGIVVCLVAGNAYLWYRDRIRKTR